MEAAFEAAATRPRLVNLPDEIRGEVWAARGRGRRVGFVPTMGALHAGHLGLIDRAVAECDDVAVSVFVNPTQFGPDEDYASYPRDLGADVSLLTGRGVRWLFAPAVDSIYPPGHATRIEVAGPAVGFEGEIRPGHFSGVATVVCRLVQSVPADAAYFGAKDWQQTRVIVRMVEDLGLPLEIVVCPTVRESDGLAMSSRNAYLSPVDRARAAALFQALTRAAALWEEGAALPAIESEMRLCMESQGVAVDYAAVVDADSLGPVADAPAMALVAGRLGRTRLLDNRLLPARRAIGR